MDLRMQPSRWWTGMVAVAVLALAVPAGAADPAWKVRVSGVWIDPDFEWEQVVAEYDERQSATAGSDLGVGFGVEYRFSDRLGVELATALLEPEFDVRIEIPSVIDITTSDRLGIKALTAALNIYLTPASPVELYVAPMIAYVAYDDLMFDLGMFCDPGMLCMFHFTVDDDVGWGALVGVDVPLGERGWLFNASAGYLDTDLEVTDPDGDTETFGFDSITASIGIAHRF